MPDKYEGDKEQDQLDHAETIEPILREEDKASDVLKEQSVDEKIENQNNIFKSAVCGIKFCDECRFQQHNRDFHQEVPIKENKEAVPVEILKRQVDNPGTNENAQAPGNADEEKIDYDSTTSKVHIKFGTATKLPNSKISYSF